MIYIVHDSNTPQRMAIRNVGHFEAPNCQDTEPFIKCYIVQI